MGTSSPRGFPYRYRGENVSNPDQEYLIEPILPARRISLLAGISSAGKSRFAIPALIMYAAGMPVFGLTSNPVPWCLVCRDRPLADAEDTIRGMGFNREDVNIIPAFGKYSKPLHEIMAEIDRLKAKLIFWEGLDMMVRNPNNPHEVAEFLSNLSAYCEEGLTVLGTVGVAKLKPHEMYDNPRQLVAGSSVWERCTSSNFIIRAINPKDISDSRRLLYVSLKNAPSFSLEGRFDDSGMLVFDDYEQRHLGAILALKVGSKKRKRTNGS